MIKLKKTLYLVVMLLMILANTIYAAGLSEELVKYGIIKEDELITLASADEISRAEMVTFTIRMRVDYDGRKDETVFEDVPTEHWASGYIKIANQLGLVIGYGDGCFGPEDSVTYVQAIKILAELLGYRPEVQNIGGFPDGYLSVANNIGIIDKMNIEDLNAPAARDDILTMLQKTLDIPLMEQIEFGHNEKFAVSDMTFRKDLNNRIIKAKESYTSYNLSVLTFSNPRLPSKTDETPEQAYLEAREKLDMSITVVTPEAATYRERLNLIIASGDLQDIMELQWNDITQFKEYGIFQPLNEAIEKYAPDMAKFLKENPDVARMVSNDKGEYIAIPLISNDEEKIVTAGPIIRKDIFNKYGLDIPKTTEEWYIALKALKENGIKTPLTISSKLPDLLSFFDAVDTFYIKDDKVYYGPAEARYKEALATASKWYKEGLLDPEFPVMKVEQADRKLIDGDAAVTFGYIGERLLTNDDNDTFKIAGVNYPAYSGKEKQLFNRLEGRASAGGVVITSRCKDVEAAMKFINFAYKDYKVDYKYPEQQEAVKIWAEGQENAECLKLPEALDFTTEETMELQKLLADITTYNLEMSIKYILGVQSFEEYDKYQEKFNNLGLSKVLQIYQDAYDRYLEH